jgi:hypothetical protein
LKITENIAMKTLNVAFAVALLATGGAATAQTASDAQCLVVSNAFASQVKEPQAQKVAEASVYFYLGRVANSMTAPQLKALLDAQAKTLTNQNAPGVMNNCAAAIQTKVNLLQSLAPKQATTPKPAAAKPAPTR